MRVQFLNDTSRYHAGSAAAVRGIRQLIHEAGHEIVGNSTSAGASTIAEDAELVVINGEGTLHHDMPRAKAMLELALVFEGPVILCNSVWDGMSDEWASRILDKGWRCFFREPLSAKAFYGGDYDFSGVLRLDASVLHPLHDFEDCDHGPVLRGHFRFKPQAAEGKTLLSLRENLWPDIVETLRSASLYMTGEQHGVYAAALARCPFVAMPGNTHKIEGLIQWGLGGQEFPLVAHDPIGFAGCVQAVKDGHPNVRRFFDWFHGEAPRLTVEDFRL